MLKTYSLSTNIREVPTPAYKAFPTIVSFTHVPTEKIIFEMIRIVQFLFSFIFIKNIILLIIIHSNTKVILLLGGNWKANWQWENKLTIEDSRKMTNDYALKLSIIIPLSYYNTEEPNFGLKNTKILNGNLEKITKRSSFFNFTII